METMEKISFEPSKPFVPTGTQIAILQAVSVQPGCTIGHVVTALRPEHSESSVRAGVRILLSQYCLDEGKSSAIILRLTSRGRLHLRPAEAR